MTALPARLSNFREVEDALDALEHASGVRTSRGWPAFDALVHCAQSVEYSVTGFPVMRSGLFRATVGPLAARKFVRQGAMSHDLTAAIPGAPTIEPNDDVRAGVARLRRSIETFRASSALRPHFAYGELQRDAYEKLQAMHIADHFAAFVLGA